MLWSTWSIELPQSACAFNHSICFASWCRPYQSCYPLTQYPPKPASCWIQVQVSNLHYILLHALHLSLTSPECQHVVSVSCCITAVLLVSDHVPLSHSCRKLLAHISSSPGVSLVIIPTVQCLAVMLWRQLGCLVCWMTQLLKLLSWCQLPLLLLSPMLILVLMWWHCWLD